MNLRQFGTFNSDLERELSEESTLVNNGKMIATPFLDIFTWPVIFRIITFLYAHVQFVIERKRIFFIIILFCQMEHEEVAVIGQEDDAEAEIQVHTADQDVIVDGKNVSLEYRLLQQV
jgi:hypothetical protein